MKPALTEEEWADVTRADAGDYNMAPLVYGFVNGQILNSPLRQLNRPAAVAALCLHGQEYGFKRWMVKWLEHSIAIPDLPDEVRCVVEEDEDPVAAVDQYVAQIIEVLLPPEETDE